MAINYKEVEYNFSGYDEQTYHKLQTFTNTDEGISSVQFRSQSLNFDDDSGPISYDVSGSHYNFINGLLFEENGVGASSFYDYPNLYNNKFHPSGSVIYIPQQYYGEEIKPNSFELTDNHNAQTIVIKDDGKGNLYSSNAINSRSAASSISSSENYVGNIQYQMGIVTITETGSWSGSGAQSTDVMYTDVGTDAFTLKFNATQKIYTNQIVAKIDKSEFNGTTNTTVFNPSSSNGAIIENISSSILDWTPYATTIAFYDKAPRYSFSNPSIINFPIVPGENLITWFGETIPLEGLNNANIPDGIYSITAIGGMDSANKNSNGEWMYTGGSSIGFPRYGQQLRVMSNAPSEVEWVTPVPENEVTDVISPQTPLLVANFPKPVKIDKNSDLTIIIRYDT